jgi:hypothetical protein
MWNDLVFSLFNEFYGVLWVLQDDVYWGRAVCLFCGGWERLVASLRCVWFIRIEIARKGPPLRGSV